MTWNAANSRRVPDKGSADNNTINDVIGNKNDVHSDSSIYGLLREVNEHNHGTSFVVPDSADSITLVSSDVAWNWGGAKVELVAADSITTDFGIYFADMVMDANSEYQVKLWRSDASEYVEIATFAAERNSNQIRASNIPVHMELQEANSRILASVASSAASADETLLKCQGHAY